MRLGLIHDLGLWMPKETTRANALFKKGCVFEHEEACKMVRH